MARSPARVQSHERPAAGVAGGPSGARGQVAHYLGVVVAAEEQLRDALILVAERHERNYELSAGATVLAVWSSEHVAKLEPLQERYGRLPSESAEQLRAALLGGTRVGTVGELSDACDLAVLAQSAEMTWTILVQGARELHDETLLDLALAARDQTRRQLAWLRTIVEHEAPDAIAVVPDWSGQLAATLPKRLTAIASIPDLLWAPAVAAGLVVLVGRMGVLLGQPLLVPSLGPSAALIALLPSHPTARAWNTVTGHLIGLLAGFAAVALAGAASAPSVLSGGELTWSRVGAATLAMALTLAGCALARAGHPPAAATTLLVALGGDRHDRAGACPRGRRPSAGCRRRARSSRSTPTHGTSRATGSELVPGASATAPPRNRPRRPDRDSPSQPLTRSAGLRTKRRPWRMPRPSGVRVVQRDIRRSDVLRSGSGQPFVPWLAPSVCVSSMSDLPWPPEPEPLLLPQPAGLGRALTGAFAAHPGAAAGRRPVVGATGGGPAGARVRAVARAAALEPVPVSEL